MGSVSDWVAGVCAIFIVCRETWWYFRKNVSKAEKEDAKTTKDQQKWLNEQNRALVNDLQEQINSANKERKQLAVDLQAKIDDIYDAYEKAQAAHAACLTDNAVLKFKAAGLEQRTVELERRVIELEGR